MSGRDDTLPRIIGTRIRAERNQRGLSQQALADAADPPVSLRTIVNVEAGGDTRVSTVAAIARGLDTTVKELVSTD